jgi:hypothetical protein
MVVSSFMIVHSSTRIVHNRTPPPSGSNKVCHAVDIHSSNVYLWFSIDERSKSISCTNVEYLFLSIVWFSAWFRHFNKLTGTISDVRRRPKSATVHSIHPRFNKHEDGRPN